MLAQFLQFLFSGVTVGATYALAALGFTLIYNASNVINFAQGEFIMLGGMLAVFFVPVFFVVVRRLFRRRSPPSAPLATPAAAQGGQS